MSDRSSSAAPRALDGSPGNGKVHSGHGRGSRQAGAHGPEATSPPGRNRRYRVAAPATCMDGEASPRRTADGPRSHLATIPNTLSTIDFWPGDGSVGRATTGSPVVDE